MNISAPNQTLYYLQRGPQETGPFTLAQLRSMWQNGVATADARYRFDPAAPWQPLTNLCRLLDGVPPAATAASQSLVLPIVALVLACIPFICIAGVFCAHMALRQARATNNATGRVIAIVALVVGYLLTIHTVLILALGSVVLFKPYVAPPDFTQ